MLIERLHNVEARVETSVISTLIFFVKIPLMARKHGKKSQDKELKRSVHYTTGEFTETEEDYRERARNLFIDVGYKYAHLGKNSRSIKNWHGDDEFYDGYLAISAVSV